MMGQEGEGECVCVEGEIGKGIKNNFLLYFSNKIFRLVFYSQ
jgi:hypothetical protein